MQCRTSRIRLSDIPRLFVLQLPVRCTICLERFHVGYRTSLRMLSDQRSRSYLVMEAHILQSKQTAPSNEKHSGMIDIQ